MRLRVVLGDQLSHGLSSLRDLDPARDVVLLVEVEAEGRSVRHHVQKLVFILAAMRHFAGELSERGVRVDYVRLDDEGNTHTFDGELRRAIARHAPSEVVLTEPSERRVLALFEAARPDLGVPLTVRNDDRFFASRADFAAWSEGRASLRMEHFYRVMRRRTGYLVDGGEPEGGAWNYDAENRKRLPAKERVPSRLRFSPDAMTREVIELVRRRFPDHPGRLEPFEWAVDRAGAERALAEFVEVGLPRFGDYQDAMKQGAPYLFHGLVSPYLNVGLLDAKECCEAAIGAYRAGRAPLAATEGFVRQILGWREYVRGIYWHAGPDYAASNALGATRPLPALYWTGETELACLRACVRDTLDRAYAHHIQRLMVLGNFALLAGVAPSELEAWFLAVYADAFEWVELPNVHGMALYADGGLLASKPYAASGAYIDRMSDYCQSCQYSPKEREGERACPLNALYWDFVDRNRDALRGNPRMAMPYKNLDAMPAARREQVRRDAARFLSRLDAPTASERGGAS